MSKYERMQLGRPLKLIEIVFCLLPTTSKVRKSPPLLPTVGVLQNLDVIFRFFFITVNFRSKMLDTPRVLTGYFSNCRFSECIIFFFAIIDSVLAIGKRVLRRL